MHRFTTANGINLIKEFEGFHPQIYMCPGNYRTIGYGHKLLSEEKYTSITCEDAEELLAQDLLIHERAVIKHINVELNDNQFDALVSFTFNLGPAALQRSTLKQKINYELYHEARYEFLKWIYVGKKKLPGLLRRRAAESSLFAS